MNEKKYDNFTDEENLYETKNKKKENLKTSLQIDLYSSTIKLNEDIYAISFFLWLKCGIFSFIRVIFLAIFQIIALIILLIDIHELKFQKVPASEVSALEAAKSLTSLIIVFSISSEIEQGIKIICISLQRVDNKFIY